MRFPSWLAGVLLLAFAAGPARAWQQSNPAPPLPRELRAMWIATKGNIDWPSRPGLPVARQQDELRQLLELARTAGLNAVVLQVRPQSDAFYASTLEPWSEYLTGREGNPPMPRWDPLEFACREAHNRGLELHAWINPFRARAETSRAPTSAQGLASHRPDLVRSYGSQLWFDPGEPDVREHGLRVIADIVRRYDIDALHMDDYFYPYPVKDAAGRNLPFPDDSSYQRFGRGWNRSDWRRANVDEFVDRAGATVHREKPWVQFGISPFGIWRPNVPPGIRGLDAYEALYADAKRWTEEGWVDYIAPQLYWNISPREQSFPLLLNWWSSINRRNRHLYAGIATARVGLDRDANEIVNQVRLVQAEGGANGLMLWNASSIASNKGRVTDRLRSTVLRLPALPPATPWRWTNAPRLHDLTVSLAARGEHRVSWEVHGNEPVRQFAVQVRRGNVWSLDVLPPTRKEIRLHSSKTLPPPDEIRVTPLGRAGAAGSPGFWRRHL